MSEKKVLATMTGELFQPVRLHYNVFDRKGLLRAFKKLRCVARDPTRLRWLWLYDFKARNLSFKQSHAQIPEQHQPIVIGYFLPKSEERMVLDLRSCERAMLALPFFDEHIPRKVARITEVEVVNRLFSAEDSQLTPEHLFDRQETPPSDPEALWRKMADEVAALPDPQERIRRVTEFMQSNSKRTLPEIERLPVHFYAEGIHGFTLILRTRQIIAYQHWLGNMDYSMSDAIHEIMRKA